MLMCHKNKEMWALAVRNDASERTKTHQTSFLFIPCQFIHLFLHSVSLLSSIHVDFFLFISFYPCQPGNCLWDWFQIKSEGWQTQRNHIQYFRFVVQLCESKGTDTNVSVSPDSNTAFNSPESVSAQTAKPHKPRTDRTLLATTSARESPALQWAESQRAGIISGITGSRRRCRHGREEDQGR